MIVNKINSYLSTNGQELPEEYLDEVSKHFRHIFDRQFGLKEAGERKLRLSSIGKCVRQNAYNLIGTENKGKEIDSRGRMTFFQGDMAELAIIALSRLSGCKVTSCGLNQEIVEILGIQGHPDGIVESDANVKYLLEVKSMSSYSFKEFEDGTYLTENEFGRSYLYQINAYMLAMELEWCVFVALNKDAGVLAERIIKADPVIQEDIKQRILLLKAYTTVPPAGMLPARPYIPDSKGMLPAACLYCGFWGHCWPTAEKVLVSRSYKLKVKS